MVLESLSLRTAYKEASAHRTGHGSWLGWIRRSKQPELPVVLLEDTGALVGLVFALAGVTLAHVTGEPRWDALGSIAIGLLLVVIAILLAVEMKGLLIGESASPSGHRGDRHGARAAPRRCGASSTCGPSTSAPTTCSSPPSSSSSRR